jgi:hypothetical protein
MIALSIKILGPGCANCYILEGLAVAAVQFLRSQKPALFRRVRVTLQHLNESSDFRKYGVLRTPGLVVNEKLAVTGRLLTVLEIMALFEKTLADGKAKTPRAKATTTR